MLTHGARILLCGIVCVVAYASAILAGAITGPAAAGQVEDWNPPHIPIVEWIVVNSTEAQRAGTDNEYISPHGVTFTFNNELSRKAGVWQTTGRPQVVWVRGYWHRANYDADGTSVGAYQGDLVNLDFALVEALNNESVALHYAAALCESGSRTGAFGVAATTNADLPGIATDGSSLKDSYTRRAKDRSFALGAVLAETPEWDYEFKTALKCKAGATFETGAFQSTADTDAIAYARLDFWLNGTLVAADDAQARFTNRVSDADAGIVDVGTQYGVSTNAGYTVKALKNGAIDFGPLQPGDESFPSAYDVASIRGDGFVGQQNVRVSWSSYIWIQTEVTSGAGVAGAFAHARCAHGNMPRNNSLRRNFYRPDLSLDDLRALQTRTPWEGHFKAYSVEGGARQLLGTFPVN